ncbi:MAG: ComEC/Rec2 family competence protein [Actinocatenispora sp.]
MAILVAIRAAPGTAALLGVLGLGSAAALGAGWWVLLRRQGIRPLPGGYRVAGLVLRLLLPVLLGAGSGALATAARTQLRDRGELATLAARSSLVRAELTLTSDPIRVRHAAFGPPTWMAEATMRRYTALGTVAAPVRLHARVLVFGTGDRWRSLLPGQPLSTTARLTRPQRADLTMAVLSVRAPPHLTGRPPWYQRFAGRLRAGLREACRGLPAAPGGLLPGLVDGDVSTLDPAVTQDFTTAGMTHLTAVSGSNVAVVTAFILLLARWGRAGPRAAAIAGLLGTVGFVILARPDPSVLRAALMGGLGLVARGASRPRASLPILGSTAFVLLVADPQLAIEWGFALSVLATLGLLLFAPAWRDALRRRGVPAGLAELVAISLAAHVACAPAIAGFTATVGIAAIPANVLAEPAVAPATMLGVGAAALSPVSPSIAHLLAWLACWPCWWLVLVARYAARAPAAVLSWPGGILGGLLLGAVLIGLVLLAGHRTLRRVLLIVVLAALLGAAPVRVLTGGWPPAGWILVACDVGQGDGLVLNVGSGQGIVVDTGPEPIAIDRCLRQLGVRSVPLLVLTHDDADHVGGVDGVFHGRHVSAVAVSRFEGTAGGRGRILRAAGRQRLTPFAAVPGWSYRAGALRLTVLGTPGVLTGTESDTNNNCVVLRVVGHGVSALLTGDAGPEEQAALRREGAVLHADVLKVAHHGSRNRDPGFVGAVAPRLAVVSVGADNDYGQPNGPLLREMRRAGIEVFRTDRDGDVAVVATAGGGVAVARHGLPPGRDPP